MRNLEYARLYRKRTNSRRTRDRRTASNPQLESDNEFLSAVFGTISFGTDEENGSVGKPRREGQAPEQKESKGAVGAGGTKEKSK